METFKTINFWVRAFFGFLLLICVVFLMWICDWLGAVEEFESK